VAAIQVDQQPERWPSTSEALRNGHLKPEAARDVPARLDRSVEFVGPFKFCGAPTGPGMFFWISSTVPTTFGWLPI